MPSASNANILKIGSSVLKRWERIKVEQIIDNLVYQGCSCDLLYGYECGIHMTAKRAKIELFGDK